MMMIIYNNNDNNNLQDLIPSLNAYSDLICAKLFIRNWNVT